MSDKKKIFIIDDEEDFATLASVRLEEAGYEVYSETEGKRALERAKALQPDIIFLDVVLLGSDGLTLLKKLKKELASVPIVMVTGKAVMMKEIFEMEGASAFFKKPLDFKQLVNKVKELIG